MSTKTIALEYANALIFELEKAFWDERGKGARFRMTTVGRQYFEQNCLPRLASGDIEHVVQTVADVLKEDSLADELGCSSDGRLLRIQVQGCVHAPVERQMLACGVQPFTCMPANLIALGLETKLDRPVELAEIKLEDGVCQLLLVLFDKRPELA